MTKPDLAALSAAATQSVLDNIAALRAEIERLKRAAALSDLIAADAHLIDTVADSDGDDGA